MSRRYHASFLVVGLALCLGAAPATVPATRPGAARDPRDLSTIPGVSIIRQARNQEEAEEQQGSQPISRFSRSTSLFGFTTIEATGHPEAILRSLSEDGRVFVEGVTLPKEIYVVKASGGQAAVLTGISKAYEAVFKVRITQEARDIDVLVLTVDPEKIKDLPRSTKRNGSFGYSGDGASTKATLDAPFAQLVRSLERELEVPVIDESGRTESFQLSFSWTKANKREDITASLGKLGITLKPEKRKLRGLFVDMPLPATQPQ
jgi:hypothetical protein